MAILDDFNRADEDPLSGGGAWGALGTQPQLKVVSNKATGNFEDASRYLTTFGPNVTMSTKWGVGNVFIEMLLGLQDGHLATYDGYQMSLLDAEGREIHIFRIDDGVNTTPLASLIGGFPITVSGDVVSFSRVGTALRIDVNGVTLLETTDSTYMAAGQLALWISSTGDTFEDFSAETILPATTLLQSGSMVRRI